ncbi:MAG: substrate-binding domain-containing protein [Cellvibrionaceae bacterium]
MPRNILIVHNEAPTSELSRRQLRTIFSLRVNRWDNNVPITLFVLPDDHASHYFFIRHVLNMLPHQLRRHWDHHVYAGLGQGPITVHSEEEMLKRVKATPGSMGYLSPEATPQGVKVVSY